MMLRFGPQYGRTTLSTLSTGSGISPPASNWSGFDSLGGMGVVLGINFVIAFSVNLYYAARVIDAINQAIVFRDR
jgi:hypothetical protein